MGSCKHQFIDDNGIEYCSLCGLEELTLQHADISLTKEFYINGSNRLLGELTEKQKKAIYSLSENVFRKNSLRGNRKKAIIAVCYMYLNIKEGVYYTCSDIIKKFSIDKKRFSFAARSVQTAIPEFRVLVLHPKNFTLRVIQEFSNMDPIDHIEVEKLCDIAVQRNKSLTNLNPYNVCACIVYKFFLASKIKRCTFIKTVKISDSSMQKILPLIEV